MPLIVFTMPVGFLVDDIIDTNKGILHVERQLKRLKESYLNPSINYGMYGNIIDFSRQGANIQSIDWHDDRVQLSFADTQIRQLSTEPEEPATRINFMETFELEQARALSITPSTDLFPVDTIVLPAMQPSVYETAYSLSVDFIPVDYEHLTALKHLGLIPHHRAGVNNYYLTDLNPIFQLWVPEVKHIHITGDDKNRSLIRPTNQFEKVIIYAIDDSAQGDRSLFLSGGTIHRVPPPNKQALGCSMQAHSVQSLYYTKGNPSY